MILNEMTGRTQNDLRIKIKNLSQKFLDLWFIKDDKDTPYSKSNLKENVTVIRKIPGKESEVNINQTIFRFTLDGRIIVNSWDFNRLLKYATQPLDELVYLIFNKTPPQITRERYKIPDTCPSVVRNILDKAIGAYINLFYEFAAVGSRSAIETLLRIIYQQRTNHEPFDHPHSTN